MKEINKVKIIKTLQQIRSEMDVSPTKAKQRLSSLINNIIEEKGKIFQ